MKRKAKRPKHEKRRVKRVKGLMRPRKQAEADIRRRQHQ
jgi:hypothetical protein